MALGGSRRAKLKDDGPSLEPGNAFRLNGKGGWDVVKLPEDVISKATFSGFLTIHGVKSSVFETPDGEQWAQRTPPAGLNVEASMGVKLDRISRVMIGSAIRIAGASVSWVAPSLEEEEEELIRLADEEGFDMPSLLQEARRAKLRTLKDSDWGRLEGTDSFGVSSVGEAAHIAEGYGRDVDSVIQGMAQGSGIPAPIVLERADGSITLVSGNARLMAARALGLAPQVLWVTAPG